TSYATGFRAQVLRFVSLNGCPCIPPMSSHAAGITVKSRTRRKEQRLTQAISSLKQKYDREKLIAACKAFNCEPGIGVQPRDQNCRSLEDDGEVHRPLCTRPGSKARPYRLQSGELVERHCKCGCGHVVTRSVGRQSHPRVGFGFRRLIYGLCD